LVTLGLLAVGALAALVPASARATDADVPLVRMRDGHGSDLLLRLNPRTLRQVGRPIRTFRGGSDLRISPDGTRLAFADSFQRRSRIHFVDLARWRSMGVARFDRRGWLTVGWLSQDRLLAISDQGLDRQRLLWIDVASRTVIARRAYSGWNVNAVTVPGGLAVALGPREGVGALRLLLVDPSGGIRTIRLGGIKAGGDYADSGGQILTPALTVDPDGGRMYVVAARGLLVAQVDLASGAVSYHSLGASASKGNVDMWWREATWAGDGRIAVTGDHWPPVGHRRPPRLPVPFGIRIVDTRNWSIITLDPRPNSMHVADGTVLAAGTQWFYGARRPKSTGLLAFDQSGRHAFIRFRGRQVALLGSRGDVGYAWVRRTRTAHVLDLDSGRTLHTIRTGPRAPSLLSPP
jgi:hypothetical protein